MTSGSAGTRLLARYFFRRFVDNDLISPQGEAPENITLVLAFFVAAGLLGSTMLMFAYLNPFVSPYQRLVSALNDKFLGLAWSMIVMALATVIEWDALALDVRDFAVLGPLPIERRILVVAKLRALFLFMGVFAVAVNGLPTIVYPALLATALSISATRFLWLVCVHAATCVAAATFAFLAVLALRETLRGFMGARLFLRASGVVQFVSVLVLVTALLVVPHASSNTASALATGGPALFLSPPMWFVGLYETLGAQAVRAAPTRATGVRTFWNAASNWEARTQYLRHETVFRELASVGLVALLIAGIVAIGGNVRHSRHFIPAQVSRCGVCRWLCGTTSWLAARSVVREPIAQAGFFFTLQTLARSASHRMYMAAYMAVGFATAVTVLTAHGVWQALAGNPSNVLESRSAPSVELLALQMVLSFFLIVGLRVVFTVPAELKANWTFQFSWPGDFRRYLAGVRRAVSVALLLPLLAAFLPFHTLLWGPRIAAMHMALGWLASQVLVEVLFFHFRKVPFTCSYLPGKGNLKFRWPFYVVGFITYTSGFAWLEGFALANSGRFVVLVIGLCAALGAFWAMRQRFRRRPADVIFEEPLERAAQSLGLSA